MPLRLLLALTSTLCLAGTACSAASPTEAVLPAPFTVTASPEGVSPEVLRLVALGDAGEGNASQRLNAEAIAATCAAKADALGPGCHLAVYLGDNVYPDGVASPEDPQWQAKFSAPMAAVDLPFYAVLGNHDYGERGFDEERALAQVGWTGDPRWQLPARSYLLDAGPARLVALDTNPVLLEPLWGESPQRRVVDAALEGAPEGAWRVVLGHHPWRSDGRHGNAGEYEGSGWIPVASGGSMRDFLETHLCGRADLYLAGHDHNLQWQTHCGVDLVVSGSGSKVVPLVGRGNSPRFASDELEGFAWLELRADGTGTLEFWDRTGALLHSGVLRR